MNNFFRLAFVNWRTTVAGFIVLAGLVAAVGPLVGLSAGVIKFCLIVVTVGGSFGFLSSADAKRLAALEALMKALPMAKAVEAAPEPSPAEPSTEDDPYADAK